MSALLELLLLVWGASLAVLAVALSLVVAAQGLTRHTRTALRRTTRPAATHLTGDRTQPV